MSSLTIIHYVQYNNSSWIIPFIHNITVSLAVRIALINILFKYLCAYILNYKILNFSLLINIILNLLENQLSLMIRNIYYLDIKYYML